MMIELPEVERAVSLKSIRLSSASVNLLRT